MNQLNFNVNGNLLTLNNKPMVTSGSVNYDTCTFNFNKAWKGFSKTAVFTMEDDETCCVSLENTSTCKIPGECLMKRGVLKIGVVGEKDDSTVISTNLVAYRVVQGANEESLDLPDENYPQQPIDPSPESRSNVALWMDERLNLSQDLVLDDYLNVDNTDIQSYYDVTFSRLARLYPDYVTRVTEIEDSTGNPIDSFTFASENYDRTILITANHLGYKMNTLMALSGFFKELCENYQSNAALRFLHNKVKIVVLPIICPQAMMNSSRHNDNEVAPFVNYDNLWDNSPIEDKGDYSFSEMETIAYLSVIENLLSDNLVWAFDFESAAKSGNTQKIYYRANGTVNVNLINEAVSKFSVGVGSRFTEFCESQAPIATNYSNLAYNTQACTVIWYGNDLTSVTSVDILNYARFIGNMIFETAYNSDIIKKAVLKPIVKHVRWRGVENKSDHINTTNSMSPVWISAYKQFLFGTYNVHMNGYVIVESQTKTKVRVKPMLTQLNTAIDDYDERFNDDNYDVEFTANEGITVIPFDTVIRCNYANASHTSDPSILYSLIAMASQASVKVTGFSYTLNMIASDGKDSVEVLTPSGKASDYTNINNTPIFNTSYPQKFYDVI